MISSSPDAPPFGEEPRCIQPSSSPSADPVRAPRWTKAAHVAALLLVLSPLAAAQAVSIQRLRQGLSPATYPVPDDGSGIPYALAPSPLLAVFLPVGVALVVMLILAGIGALVLHLPTPRIAGGDPVYARELHRGASGVLAALEVALALVFCAAVTLPMLGLVNEGRIGMAAAGVVLVLVAAGGALHLLALRLRHALRRS